MACGAADMWKFRCVLHIEEKERRRTQSEVFTATDRTGSRELGLPQGTQSSVCACSALVGSQGSVVQSLGGAATTRLQLTYFASLSLHQGWSTWGSGLFQEAVSESQPSMMGWLPYHIPLKIQNYYSEMASIACLPPLLQGLA